MTVVMFTETQLLLAKEAAQKSPRLTLHLDVTGSVVQKCGQSPIYLYAVVLPTPVKGEPSLPLLEWLSDSHNTTTIASVLFTWWLSAIHYIPPPAVIVTDNSWAFLHATSKVFNNLSLEDQMDKQWQVLSGDELPTGFVSLRLCASHYIKAIGNRLSKMTIKQQVRPIRLHRSK